MIVDLPLGGNFKMAEFAIFAGMLGVTGGAFFTGIALGARYIDQKLRTEDFVARSDEPLVRPPPPYPIQWEDVETR